MEGGIPITTYSNVSMFFLIILFENEARIPGADDHPLQPRPSLTAPRVT